MTTSEISTDVKDRLNQLTELANSDELKLIVDGKGPAGWADAAQLAIATQKAEALMTAQLVEKVFLPLQGKPYGFLTDKDKTRDGKPGKGYPMEVVREVMIDALMQGFRPNNNELNIIGGRFFPALNGMRRKVREFPGLADLKVVVGMPKAANNNKNAQVPVTITYKLDGEAYQQDSEEITPLYGTDGVDSIQSKAENRALKRLWRYLTGSDHIDDADDVVHPSKASGQLFDGNGLPVDVAERTNEGAA